MLIAFHLLMLLANLQIGTLASRPCGRPSVPEDVNFDKTEVKHIGKNWKVESGVELRGICKDGFIAGPDLINDGIENTIECDNGTWMGSLRRCGKSFI